MIQIQNIILNSMTDEKIFKMSQMFLNCFELVFLLIFYRLHYFFSEDIQFRILEKGCNQSSCTKTKILFPKKANIVNKIFISYAQLAISFLLIVELKMVNGYSSFKETKSLRRHIETRLYLCTSLVICTF